MKRMLILHICTLCITDHLLIIARSPSIIVLYPANTINFVCFRYQHYKCIFRKTISKTKTILLFKTYLELGLAKISIEKTRQKSVFCAKLHEIIQIHILECNIFLILAQRPCKWFRTINPYYPYHTQFRGNDK